MPENAKSLRNDSASVDEEVEEAMKRLEIASNDDEGNEVGVFPERPGEPDCSYYMRTGSCGYGTNCRFNHPSNVQIGSDSKNGELPERVGQQSCGHYLKTGTCKYGSTCKYNHPKDREFDTTVSLNVLGLPLRQDAKPCPYYMRTGSCKYGYACKFHHPQPLSAAKSGVQSSSGEFSAPSLVPGAAAYLPFPLFPLPHDSMPFVVPPSQGWSSYAGSISPLLISNGQLPVSHLPERPDQPECRYFKNRGSCKYGSECKYHHPRERILQFSSSTFGPLGLPLRPGEPLLSFGGYPPPPPPYAAYTQMPTPSPYSSSPPSQLPYQGQSSNQVPSS